MWLIRDVILISALVSSFCIYAHKDDSEKPPIFTWVNCNATGLKCLEIDFQDGFPNDLAVLTPVVNATTNCILEGTLRDEGVRIVVTTDCPFDKYDNLLRSLFGVPAIRTLSANTSNQSVPIPTLSLNVKRIQ